MKNSPSTRNLRGVDFGCLLLLLAFAVVFSLEQIDNYDIWWHLKSGQWIWDNKAIPHFDPFSFTTAGEAWINASWLSGPLFFGVYSWLGAAGLIGLKALLIATAFGVAFVLLVRRGTNPLLALFLLGFAVVFARYRFMVRPHVVMFPFSVAFLWILSSSRELNWRRTALLLSLLFVWTNLHGSAFLGLVLCGFRYVDEIGRVAFARCRGGEAVGGSFRRWTALVALGGVALCVTPYGWTLPWKIVERSLFADLLAQSFSVEEHLPIAWGDYPGFWAMLFMTAISFLLVRRNLRLFSLLTSVGMSWVALGSVRYAGYAVFVNAIIVGLNLSAWAKEKGVPWLSSTSRRQAAFGLPLLMLAAIFSFKASYNPSKVHRWGMGVNEALYPVAATDFLGEIGFEGNLFNSWTYGGYLMWHLPEAKTFIDGRVLDAQLALQQRLADMSPKEFSQYLIDNDVKGALFSSKEKGYADFFQQSPFYRLQFLDDRAMVYLRTDVAAAVGGGGFALRYIRPDSYDVSYLVPLAKGDKAEAVEQELKRAIELSPDSFMLRFQYGFFLELLGRQEALRQYEEAARVNPSLAFTHFQLGVRGGRLAVRTQQWDRAIALLGQAAEFGEESSELNFLLGTAHYQLRQFGMAEKAFRETLAGDQNHLITLTNLGFLYVDTSRWDEAAEMFERALASAPEKEGARYGLALAYQGGGDSRAVELWREFLRDFPKSRYASKARKFLSAEEGRR